MTTSKLVKVELGCLAHGKTVIFPLFLPTFLYYAAPCWFGSDYLIIVPYQLH